MSTKQKLIDFLSTLPDTNVKSSKSAPTVKSGGLLDEKEIKVNTKENVSLKKEGK